MPTKVFKEQFKKIFEFENPHNRKKKNIHRKPKKKNNNNNHNPSPYVQKQNIIDYSASSVFTNIYKTNHWGYGSGEGSLLQNNLSYIHFLQNYLPLLHIRKISDIGCGDWQFSKYMNWDNYDYTGYDVVQFLIENHRVNYSKENIRFECFDIIQNYNIFPETELIILKDVVQHWPLMNIVVVLSFLLKKCKYLIITNCCFLPNQTLPSQNLDIRLGEFRPLDFSLEPLNIFTVEKIFEFHTKKTFLIKGTL